MIQKRLLLAIPAAGGLVLGGGVATASADGGVWDRVAQCESGGNWSTNTGNGYHGGLQFSPSTWRAHGGQGSAANASKSEQIRVAKRVLATQGPGAWPTCGRKAGLSKSSGGSASSTPERTSQNHRSESRGNTSYKKYTPKSYNKYTPKRDFVRKAPAQRNYVAPKKNFQRNTFSVRGTYMVKPGDTLGKIADAQNVRGGWRAIYSANSGKLSTPHMVYVGQSLNLPR